MGGNDICSPSLCLRYGRRHLKDALFLPIYRLEVRIRFLVKEHIWTKLPQGRREEREWYAQQPRLMLAGGREERQSNPDWHREEHPIQYEEPASIGKPHRIVSKDNRVWTVTDGERLMTK